MVKVVTKEPVVIQVVARVAEAGTATQAVLVQVVLVVNRLVADKVKPLIYLTAFLFAFSVNAQSSEGISLRVSLVGFRLKCE